METEVWIASSTKTRQDMYYLRQALISILYALPEAKIIISSYSKIPIDFLSEFHQHNLLQFEHLRYIFSKRILSDDSWVVFMDDDDILFPTIKKYLNDSPVGFAGEQILPLRLVDDEELVIGTGNESIYDVIDMFCAGNYGRVVSDFSGTSLRYKYVRDYFEHNPIIPRYCPQMEDTELYRKPEGS